MATSTLVFIMVFGHIIMAEKTSETYEKFYTADNHDDLRPGVPLQHGTMGISTLAKFSMLSNTPTLFKVKRPGINNNANTVSFESIQKPGHYLRYKNYKFHMEKNQDSEHFEKDATFRERQGPRGRAYELLGRENWFICHSEDTPYTLKVKSEKIGTKEFVENCVYVPVRQQFVEKKNIVKTVPSGQSMVVNTVPSTQTADRCISLRFVNKLGGPVRVVSSLKPEGYLVTANAFKLKTIFKHANHKQRHVIFYAENVQDRDDDVLLNGRNVFTVKPNECTKLFQDVVLSSQIDDSATEIVKPKPANVITKSAHAPETSTNKPAPKPTAQITPTTQDVPRPISPITPTTQDAPQPPAVSSASPKPPAINGDIPKPPAINGDIPKAPATNDDTPKPPATNDDTTISPADKPITSPNSGQRVTSPSLNTGKPQIASPTKNKPVPGTTGQTSVNYHPPNSITTPDDTRHKTIKLKEIQTLDNVFEKRVQGSPVRPSLGSSAGAQVYDTWSSFGTCSASCGVGYRRRTRICRPGAYCNGPSSETRACIKEQCASDCIHAVGGSVRPGSCCYFPFTFNGAEYYHCILSPRNNERLWCGTTPYFDHDKQWGYCPLSTKAPIRSLFKQTQPIPQLQQQPKVAPVPTRDYSSYYNNRAYSDPYRAYKSTNVPCHPMCNRVCVSTCPGHCCLSTRTNLPMTAYMGNSYGPTDKRSFINTDLTPRYKRSSSRKR